MLKFVDKVGILTVSPECYPLTNETWLMFFCHVPL
jgi:hypothetical protein